VVEKKNSMQSQIDGAAAQETQIDRVTQKLRELVLSGEFPLHTKVAEQQVAKLLGVSRTPARLAMAVLAQEGLLVGLPRRGFRVRSFTIKEIVDAIQVRGELEAMAARLAAMQGLASADRTRLEACIERTEGLLKLPQFDIEDRIAWCHANLVFHEILIDAAANASLLAAYNQVIRVPLASPRAIVFNQTHPDVSRTQLLATHEDHVRIVECLVQRDAMRAAALTREHAYRSGENKRKNFADMMNRRLFVETPGLALIETTRAGDGRGDARTRRSGGPSASRAGRQRGQVAG